jgi:glycosyltransferase involved in cell wall biosynthesis
MELNGKNSLTVLIPFYNEERSLTDLVHQLSQLPSSVVHNVIFVNDGSSDGSLALLESALSTTNLSHKIISKSNGGKSSAIKVGAEHVETSHVVILDSDLELATSDIIRLWHIVQYRESDYVFGYRRFLAHSSFTWRYSRGNQLISNIYGLLFNEVITDIMCGYKLVPSDFLKSLPFKYRKFGLEIEIPMHLWKERLRPFEIEVSYKARTRAQGKSISFKDAMEVILSLIKFRIINRRSND